MPQKLLSAIRKLGLKILELSKTFVKWFLVLSTNIMKPENLNLIEKLLRCLLNLLEILKKTQRNSLLEKWADAIEKYEAMDTSYNNPGALRWSKFQAGTRNGFAFFESYADGRRALLHQLRIAAEGKSQHYKPDMTLKEFFSVYAPSADNNDPDAYALFVVSFLGVSSTTTIKELL